MSSLSKNQPCLILTRGLPGSGKSTWAKSEVSKNPGKTVIVCRDDFRVMQGGFNSKAEQVVTDMQVGAAQAALKAGKTVIVADTNLNPKTMNMWKRKAQDWGVEAIVKSFEHVPVETCIERDLKRTDSVGAKVIREMYSKYLRPPVQPIKGDPNLPWAVICDIDGTIAKMGDRSPYDWKKVGIDEPNHQVLSVVTNLAQNCYLFFFSGRDAVCRKETEEWLSKYAPIHDGLFMRPEGSGEKDFIVKERMYRELIEGRYNVRAVIDDRLQVCRMWYELGLPLFRVGDPDADF